MEAGRGPSVIDKDRRNLKCEEGARSIVSVSAFNYKYNFKEALLPSARWEHSFTIKVKLLVSPMNPFSS